MRDGLRHFKGSLADVWPAVYQVRADLHALRLPPPSDVVTNATPLVARVYRGLWIADCVDCAGAEFVWLAEPVAMCASCFNVMIGHHWRPVIVPANPQDIEAVLNARPMLENRNWSPAAVPSQVRARYRLPSETLADLQIENISYGVPESVP